MPRIGVGTCGWSYADWVTRKDCRPRITWLSYSERLGIVEVDSTFYRPPTPRMVRSWHDKTPEGFAFCLKVDVFQVSSPQAARSSSQNHLKNLPPNSFPDSTAELVHSGIVHAHCLNHGAQVRTTPQVGRKFLAADATTRLAVGVAMPGTDNDRLTVSTRLNSLAAAEGQSFPAKNCF